MATELQNEVKAAVTEALDAWPTPTGQALGQVWLISISAMAIVTIAVVGALIVFLWNGKTTAELQSLTTLLLGAFIGWLGGSKANPAP